MSAWWRTGYSDSSWRCEASNRAQEIGALFIAQLSMCASALGSLARGMHVVGFRLSLSWPVDGVRNLVGTGLAAQPADILKTP